MKDLPYYLGCPSWSESAWREGLYPQNARPAEFLGLYAQVFNAVEGNTTFYARPAPATVERGHKACPDIFALLPSSPGISATAVICVNKIMRPKISCSCCDLLGRA